MIAVLSEEFGDWYTHTELDNLFDRIDAPEIAYPWGNKVAKVRAQLQTINDQSSKPMEVLGDMLEDVMELVPRPNAEDSHGKMTRRIKAQLNKKSYDYVVGQGITKLIAERTAEANLLQVPPVKDEPRDRRASDYAAVVKPLLDWEVSDDEQGFEKDVGTGSMNENPKIFVSHSSTNKEWAKRVADLLQRALHLETREIRCTSVAGYKLGVGAKSDDVLLSEIREADVFIALLSDESVESFYVVAEIGARWMTGKGILPVLTPSSPFKGLLKPPFASVHAIHSSNRADVLDLLETVSKKLGKPLQPNTSFHQLLEQLLSYRSTESASL